MNNLFLPTRADPVQASPQAIKPARRKDLPTVASFAAVMESVQKETPKASEEPRPSSDERDREDRLSDASSDQAAPVAPIGGAPTPPAQPVEPARTGSSPDQASQPVADGAGAANAAVAAITTGAVQTPPAGQVLDPAAAAGQALAASQVPTAAVTPQAVPAPQTAQGSALADPLKAEKKDSAVPDAAAAVPAPISAVPARDPNVPQRINLEDLQVPAAAQPAVQAKAKAADPASSARVSTEISAAQVLPAALDPASLQVVQPAPAGAHLTAASSATFEPARLTEAQNQNLISQVCSSVETLVKSRQTTLHLMLNPAELGRIDLRLTSSSAGMGVSLVAHQDGTSQLLESQVAQLRQALDQAGIHLTNLSVGQQGSQASTGQNNQRPHGHALHRQAVLAGTLSVEDPSAVSTRSSSEGFDYRV